MPEPDVIILGHECDLDKIKLYLTPFYFPVNTIKLSKPEKGAAVEDMLCKMARAGQIRVKLSEKELIDILESLNQQMPKSTRTVKFDRRRAALDSDDDF